MIARAAAMLLMLASLAPAPAASRPPTTPESQIKAAVERIYARYRQSILTAPPANDDTPYSRRTRDLIARWHQTQPEDEVTPLGDFDWFCQCQDYDEKAFTISSLTVSKGKAGVYQAALAYNVGWGSGNRLRLVMISEDGGWKVDDILFARETGFASLRAALAAEIRAAAK